jgi:transposase InsO family protein
MLRVLQVSASGYYEWLRRKPSSQKKRKKLIEEKAVQFFHRANFKYGYRKVHEDIVKETEIDCCKETVRKLLAKRRLFFKGKRKFAVTTNSEHKEPVADNIIKRDFIATAPDQKWVADITYIPTLEGWLYLAVVMDLFSRKVVGWSMDNNIDSNLVADALKMAIMNRQPGTGLIHHSDRGVQYASDKFQTLLDSSGIICSMSRKGDPFDNAVAESFFGKFKVEHTTGKIYKTREEAKLDIFWYIEVFYNRIRRHASLGYVSPYEFEIANGKSGVKGNQAA